MRTALCALALMVLACGGEAAKRSLPTGPQKNAPEGGAAALEGKPPADPVTAPIDRDLPKIAEAGVLRALFTFNSTGYLVYRGETMGYEYELLSRFAQESNLRLVPVVVRDSTKLFEMLNRGEGDIVAAQIVAAPTDQEVLLTTGLYATAPVLVQRKEVDPAAGQPTAVSTAFERERIETPDPQDILIRARAVATPNDLRGQSVHLSRSSAYRRRLFELDDELSGDIVVVEVDDSIDKLIQRLSEGDIRYTVAAANVAALKATEYSNLIIRPIIGPPQIVSWAVRRNAPKFRAELDRWLAVQRKRGFLNVLYRKYFLDRRSFTRRAASPYLTQKTGVLSPFDRWFREYSAVPGWDWRLVASQCYQESRFNLNARSWAGAAGVMQIMPRTARELRVNPNDARQSIEGACRYLWKIDEHWKGEIPRESERIKFILASYNIGMGHVEDARRLAAKNRDDPSNWDDVAYWLIRKSKREVYNDPVVQYGFARGTEPVRYVEAILDRFENYKAFVENKPESKQTADAGWRR